MSLDDPTKKMSKSGAPSPLATRSAYLWRASYQAGRGEYDGALATMELGAGRLADQIVTTAALAAQKAYAKIAAVTEEFNESFGDLLAARPAGD